MFESVLVRNRSIREDLAKKELTPRQISEKHGCALQTVYDISYRMRREAGIPPLNRSGKKKKSSVAKLRPRVKIINEPETRKHAVMVSYQNHLEIERHRIQEQILVLKNIEAFLSLRIKELNAAR